MNGWQQGRYSGKETITLSYNNIVKYGDVIWAVGLDPLSTTKRKMVCCVDNKKNAYLYIVIPIEKFNPILSDNKM